MRLVPLALFVAFFSLYTLSAAVSPRSFAAVGIFGSDDMSEAYEGRPSRSFIAKHPLFCFAMCLYRTGCFLFSKASPVLAHNLIMVFPMAVLGAAAVAVAYLIFLRTTLDPQRALPFTVLYGVSGSTWLFSSLPEAYALITLCSNFVLLSIVSRPRADPVNVKRTAWLNALSCFASPQQIFLFIVPALCWLHEVRLWLAARRALQYGVIVSGAFLIPYEVYLRLIGMGCNFGPVYLNIYAHPSNLVNYHLLLVVVQNFLMFSVIAPVTEPQRYTDPALSIFWATPLAWRLLAVLFLTFCIISFRGLRRLGAEARSLAVPLAAFLVVYMAFFLYFNPSETYLYVLPALLPWLLILQTGYCVRWNEMRRAALWGMVVYIAANSLHFRLFLSSLR